MSQHGGGFCTRCGAEQGGSFAFCANCGNRQVPTEPEPESGSERQPGLAQLDVPGLADSSPEGPEPAAGRKPDSRDRRLEVVSAVLLAAASVMTAFSLYQATRWSGVMTTSFNEASAERAAANVVETGVQQEWAADNSAWVQYRIAEEADDLERMAFIRIENFTGQMEIAHDTWAEVWFDLGLVVGIEDGLRPSDLALMSEDELLVIAAQLPPEAMATIEELERDEFYFDTVQGVILEYANHSPLFHPVWFEESTYSEAVSMNEEAADLFDEARDANQSGDDYVLGTVLFALTLFFAGIATKFHSHGVTVALLVVSCLFLVGGSLLVVQLPYH